MSSDDASIANHLPIGKYCTGCGNPLVVTAVVCPRCGSATGTIKSKTVAVLLAVFLTFWTWVYTYKKDAWKFWVGLIVSVFGFFLTFGLAPFAVWLWAIIDAAVKDNSYYTNFPS